MAQGEEKRVSFWMMKNYKYWSLFVTYKSAIL